MWFLLRMTFWLGVVLVLLSFFGSQSGPKSPVNVIAALVAAKDIVTDVQGICERQRDACTVGSQTGATLGQRAESGAKILYGFLSEQFGSKRRPSPAAVPVPPPARTSLQNTLQPNDLAPPWRAPHP
jgi:hypothetical protein